MSQKTIDILRQHRTNQIELSPSSETFQIVGGSTFKGIFDRAHKEDDKDSGNVTQKKLTPMIMVSTIPAGLTPRTSEITRETVDKTFKLNFIGKDEEGIPILWLF